MLLLHFKKRQHTKHLTRRFQLPRDFSIRYPRATGQA
jgi:DDE_Tnp_1-associated